MANMAMFACKEQWGKTAGDTLMNYLLSLQIISEWFTKTKLR